MGGFGVRSGKDTPETHSQETDRQIGNSPGAEAADLDGREWRQGVVQSAHTDAGWIKFQAKVLLYGGSTTNADSRCAKS